MPRNYEALDKIEIEDRYQNWIPFRGLIIWPTSLKNDDVEKGTTEIFLSKKSYLILQSWYSEKPLHNPSLK